MGCQRFILLTAFLFFTKNDVSAQYATVLDYLPQGTATATILQSPSQCVLPAIIQPIICGYDSYAPDPAPYPNYGNSLAPFPGYPPILFNDGDNLLRNLLYFLIFSMGNNRNTYSNTPPSYSGCCCGCAKCQCCDCPNCNKNNSKDSSSGSDTNSSAPIYIPVPIAIPVYTGPDGRRYIDGFCDDILLQEPCGQCTSCSACDKEINLIIRAE